MSKRKVRLAQVTGGALGTAAALAILAAITGTIYWSIAAVAAFAGLYLLTHW